MTRLRTCLTALIASLAVMQLLVMMTRAAPVGDERNDGTEETAEDRQTRDAVDVLGTLGKYGYLPRATGGFDNLQSPETVAEALRSFQRFTGLPVTGRADRATLQKMQSPRCGNPDVEGPSGLTGPENYEVFGRHVKWTNNTLTWRVYNYFSGLSQQDQKDAFRTALRLWSEVTPLEFHYTDGDPDIAISYGRREHGDGHPFDGTGGTLAHAFSPGSGIGGDAHFDSDEPFSLQAGQGNELVNVAAHEFGHSLGLRHSSDPMALMAPYYSHRPNLRLEADDIAGIQSLYGPRPATTPTPPVDTSVCLPSFELDAITKGQDGFVYAFRGSKVYKLGSSGLVPGYPKQISEVFSGAPERDVYGVTYVPANGKTYIFKGHQVWRFTGFTLDQGYPKSRVLDSMNLIRPSSALTINQDGFFRVVVFSLHFMFEWDLVADRLSNPNHPNRLRDTFLHAPPNPSATYQNGRGNIVFFKGNEMTVFQHRTDQGQTYSIGAGLFSSICGSSGASPPPIV